MSERLAWGPWVKELRAELGAQRGRKRISQTELAKILNPNPDEDSTSMVGKWEMKKKPQKPERDSIHKLWRLASPELRARIPYAVDLQGMSDPDRIVTAQHNGDGGYNVTSDEGKILGRAFDKMPEEDRPEALRKCLNAMAVTSEAANPSQPDAASKRHRARHS